MGRSILLATLLLAGSPSSSAVAAERTVTLAIENMTCASCPYIIRQSLLQVPGVTAVTVSYEGKTAAVTFDDSRVDVAALQEATAAVGFPSRPAAR